MRYLPWIFLLIVAGSLSYGAYDAALGWAFLVMCGVLLALWLMLELSPSLCVSWVKPKLCEARDLKGLKDGLVLFVTQGGYSKIYTGSGDSWSGSFGDQPRPRVARVLTQIAEKVLEDGSVSVWPK